MNSGPIIRLPDYISWWTRIRPFSLTLGDTVHSDTSYYSTAFLLCCYEQTVWTYSCTYRNLLHSPMFFFIEATFSHQGYWFFFFFWGGGCNSSMKTISGQISSHRRLVYRGPSGSCRLLTNDTLGHLSISYGTAISVIINVVHLCFLNLQYVYCFHIQHLGIKVWLFLLQ